MLQAHFSPRSTMLSQSTVDPAVAAAAVAAAARYNNQLSQHQQQLSQQPRGLQQALSMSGSRPHSETLLVQPQALQNIQYGSFDPVSGAPVAPSSQVHSPAFRIITWICISLQAYCSYLHPACIRHFA